MAGGQGPRVLGYARSSTAEQSRPGMSLETQESRIRAWADAVKAQVVEILSDGGADASKPLAERGAGKRIAALLESRDPDIDAVVVLAVDRLGHDTAETLAILNRFGSAKVGFVSVVDDDEAKLARVRQLRSQGMGYTKILGVMRSEHGESKHGKLVWQIIRGAMPF
jgi:predicted site-specific integrase-resolvase